MRTWLCFTGQRGAPGGEGSAAAFAEAERLSSRQPASLWVRVRVVCSAPPTWTGSKSRMRLNVQIVRTRRGTKFARQLRDRPDWKPAFVRNRVTLARQLLTTERLLSNYRSTPVCAATREQNSMCSVGAPFRASPNQVRMDFALWAAATTPQRKDITTRWVTCLPSDRVPNWSTEHRPSRRQGMLSSSAILVRQSA